MRTEDTLHKYGCWLGQQHYKVPFTLCFSLFADHAIAVCVADVLISGVPAADGCYTVDPGSAQVMRPLPLSSHSARASTSAFGVEPGPALGLGVAVASAVVEPPSASTTISVDSHVARTLSIASASARSRVSPYSSRTWMVRYTYQHWFRLGSQSAASLSLFWWRLTLGDARVRLSRSGATSDQFAGLGAQRPL